MCKKVLYLLVVGFFVGVCQPALAEGLEAELPSAPVSGGGGSDGGGIGGPP